MLKSLILGALAASALMFAASSDSKADDAWKPTPMIRSLEPESVKVGHTLTLVGEYLDKTQVRAFYFTDGKNDFKAAIVKQEAKEVKITVPSDVKPGRLRLMVLTESSPPRFLEMPVAVTVE